MPSKRAKAARSKSPSPSDDDGGGAVFRPANFTESLRRFLRPLPDVQSAEEQATLASFLRQADSLGSASAITDAFLRSLAKWLAWDLRRALRVDEAAEESTEAAQAVDDANDKLRLFCSDDDDSNADCADDENVDVEAEEMDFQEAGASAHLLCKFKSTYRH